MLESSAHLAVIHSHRGQPQCDSHHSRIDRRFCLRGGATSSPRESETAGFIPSPRVLPLEPLRNRMHVWLRFSASFRDAIAWAVLAPYERERQLGFWKIRLGQASITGPPFAPVTTKLSPGSTA